MKHAWQIHKLCWSFAFPCLCFCLFYISQRALLNNYKVCFGKPYWKCMDAVDLQMLHLASEAMVQFMDVLSFFKGMLGVVQLAELRWQCSTLHLHRASHYSKNSSLKITSLTLSYQSRGKKLSRIAFNIEALALCSYTSSPIRKKTGQRGQAINRALNKAIQKSSRALLRKDETVIEKIWGKWETEERSTTLTNTYSK